MKVKVERCWAHRSYYRLSVKDKRLWIYPVQPEGDFCKRTAALAKDLIQIEFPEVKRKNIRWC